MSRAFNPGVISFSRKGDLEVGSFSETVFEPVERAELVQHQDLVRATSEVAVPSGMTFHSLLNLISFHPATDIFDDEDANIQLCPFPFENLNTAKRYFARQTLEDTFHYVRSGGRDELQTWCEQVGKRNNTLASVLNERAPAESCERLTDLADMLLYGDETRTHSLQQVLNRLIDGRLVYDARDGSVRISREQARQLILRIHEQQWVFNATNCIQGYGNCILSLLYTDEQYYQGDYAPFGLRRIYDVFIEEYREIRVYHGRDSIPESVAPAYLLFDSPAELHDIYIHVNDLDAVAVNYFIDVIRAACNRNSLVPAGSDTPFRSLPCRREHSDLRIYARAYRYYCENGYLPFTVPTNLLTNEEWAPILYHHFKFDKADLRSEVRFTRSVFNRLYPHVRARQQAADVEKQYYNMSAKCAHLHDATLVSSDGVIVSDCYSSIIDITAYRRASPKVGYLRSAQMSTSAFRKHGTRKNMLAFLDFIFAYVDVSRPFTMVYVGAAPGHHFLGSLPLLPNMKLLLIDSSDSWDPRLVQLATDLEWKKRLRLVHAHIGGKVRGSGSLNLADVLNRHVDFFHVGSAYDRGEQIALVSDIRRDYEKNKTEEDVRERNNIVQEDSQIQGAMCPSIAQFASQTQLELRGFSLKFASIWDEHSVVQMGYKTVVYVSPWTRTCEMRLWGSYNQRFHNRRVEYALPAITIELNGVQLDKIMMMEEVARAATSYTGFHSLHVQPCYANYCTCYNCTTEMLAVERLRHVSGRDPGVIIDVIDKCTSSKLDSRGTDMQYNLKKVSAKQAYLDAGISFGRKGHVAPVGEPLDHDQIVGHILSCPTDNSYPEYYDGVVDSDDEEYDDFGSFD